MSRAKYVRWLLEKLLGSFVISAMLVWGPVVGLNLGNFGMGTVYSIVTLVSFVVSVIVYILVPSESNIFSRIRAIFSR